MDLKKIIYAGKELLPLVEGGKGVGVSAGITSGQWAKFGAIGTISGVNPALSSGLSYVYHQTDRALRQRELIAQSIEGCVNQAKIAREISGGNGAIFMNILWEMGGAKEILENVLARAKGLIDGISCGAGLPYDLAEICTRHEVFYNPIVSSARALKILWRQSYQNFKEYFGAVIYEDPWFAGGHLGFSTKDDINKPDPLFNRVKEIRDFLNEVGLKTLPIIIAGGIWSLSEVKHLMNNEELGNVMFQIGTRSMLTTETPISDDVKKRLFTLNKEDILINEFSPTGFKSSAVNNKFLMDLTRRKERIFNINIADSSDTVMVGKDSFSVAKDDVVAMQNYIKQGFDTFMFAGSKDKIVLLGANEKVELLDIIKRCVGCLSHCAYSGFTQYDKVLIPNPTHFCIQDTLQSVAHGGNFDDNLIFVGKNAYRFKDDPFYANARIPTTKELLEAIVEGK